MKRLRHSRFIALRDDKDAREVVKENATRDAKRGPQKGPGVPMMRRSAN